MPDMNAQEAKAIVLLAFRNGPIENVHGQVRCPHCPEGQQEDRITQEQMKLIMTAAVDRVYTLMYMRDQDPKAYQQAVANAERKVAHWDEPQFATRWLAAIAGIYIPEDGGPPELPPDYRPQ